MYKWRLRSQFFVVHCLRSCSGGRSGGREGPARVPGGIRYAQEFPTGTAELRISIVVSMNEYTPTRGYQLNGSRFALTIRSERLCELTGASLLLSNLSTLLEYYILF